MKDNMCHSRVLNCPQGVAKMGTLDYHNRPTRLLSVLMLTLSLFLFGANGAFAHSTGKMHMIELWAEKIMPGDEGGNALFAYRMAEHIVKKGPRQKDVTSRYASEPTIPGPTIVIDEGDEVMLTLRHVFDPGDSTRLEQVSVHVHGVHYDILSDGTLEYINLVADESATPVMNYTYHWVAAPGTAGTWAYHDHNMITLNGAEDKGLYGALIVNDHTRIKTVSHDTKTMRSAFSSVAKEYVLFIGDDAFWGQEINNRTGKQTPLWDNPELEARKNSNVRFHLIALGTNTHKFKLPGYRWVDPGTKQIIKKKTIGPLEKHVFAIRAKYSSVYKDVNFANQSLGMKGQFKVKKSRRRW
ncbi:MAG: multicopper oxidase domain-containing protein [Nitrospirales bacterium]|nr:multicopper oxidase domain-containing protein [Nitrospirales bacterium]